ncbi:hypothetical protein WMY93_006003 [Mugilogobius chulae]|uniref:Uncharacterized protein n=1 Tax=Mugilogobius chulae TaxID=88201 RepID=A0AAW0PPV1_9GOBI
MGENQEKLPQVLPESPESQKVSRSKRRALKRHIRESLRSRTRRATDCTVGEITQVTISDETFPFDYTDVQQFNSCLSAATVKDNLDALTLKWMIWTTRE